jgi:hypothetical protein
MLSVHCYLVPTHWIQATQAVNATKHLLQVTTEDDILTENWISVDCFVEVELRSFASGQLRDAYRMVSSLLVFRVEVAKRAWIFRSLDTQVEILASGEREECVLKLPKAPHRTSPGDICVRWG